MTKKSLIATLFLLCVISAISIGATLAYLRDNAKVVNTFTLGELSITLTEPSYQPSGEDTVLISNMDAIPKDPTVTLVGEDAYIFMQLTIPMEFGSLIHPPDIDEAWELIGGTNDVYVYKGSGNYKAQEGTLPPLFRELEVKNFSSEDTQDFKEAIDPAITIKAAAIQCAGYTMNDALALIEWNEI